MEMVRNMTSIYEYEGYSFEIKVKLDININPSHTALHNVTIKCLDDSGWSDYSDDLRDYELESAIDSMKGSAKIYIDKIIKGKEKTYLESILETAGFK